MGGVLSPLVIAGPEDMPQRNIIMTIINERDTIRVMAVR